MVIIGLLGNYHSKKSERTENCTPRVVWKSVNLTSLCELYIIWGDVISANDKLIQSSETPQFQFWCI